ncbi:MAG: L-threonylcarbamoyladenylate synthase [Bacteroidota bacterium]|nr:L-threonylcarbamoyladenylate synthase [Bacteroidota bacterium]
MQEQIKNSLETLKKGGIILYPTDTVWGIGCDATNEKAVEKIYNLKRRKESQSMLILLDNENKLSRYVDVVPDIAYQLIECSEEPITIIYPDARNMAKNLINEDGSIGIRIVKNDFCKKLIGLLNKPIVSTSANISGEKTPKRLNEISEMIISGVDYIVDLPGFEEGTGKPSSIIKLEVNGEFKIIRK